LYPKESLKSSPSPKIVLSNDCPENMFKSDYTHHWAEQNHSFILNLILENVLVSMGPLTTGCKPSTSSYDSSVSQRDQHMALHMVDTLNRWTGSNPLMGF
jgi:hypothetical protein